jgi:6-pyruvoyltetrahydropterin/6-carboxytetrahydropterin synthase
MGTKLVIPRVPILVVPSMTLYLRRRATFSAGFSEPPLGESGRGHDYIVELTVGGEIDPRTGMVVNIKDVDAVLQSQVVRPLQGKLLDREVPALRNRPATPEMLVGFVWDICSPALPPVSALARATLFTTPTLWAERSVLDPRHPRREQKETSPVLTLTRAYDFSASHRLHSVHLTDAENAEIFGKCNWSNGHGHNYAVEVTLAGEPDQATGLLVLPEALDAIVEEEILRPYDHRHLNYDVPEFSDLNPTSENVTRVIWDKLARRQSEWGPGSLYRIVVRETERNFFEYYGD